MAVYWDGKYWIANVPSNQRYESGRKKQIKKRFNNEEDAKRKEKEIKDYLESIQREVQNQHTQVVDINFKEAFNTWYNEHKVAGTKKSTLEGYMVYIRNHILPYFKGYRIPDISYTILVDFFSKRDYLAPSSRRQMYVILQSILTKNNNFEIKKVQKPKLTNYNRQEILEPEEINLILNRIKKSKIYVPILLLTATGARTSEVLALNWKDVDFKEGTVHFYKTAKYSKEDKETIIDYSMKNSNSSEETTKERIIYIDNFTIEELKRIKEEREDKDIDYICTNTESRIYINSSLGKSLTEKLKNTSINKKVNLHLFRHTHGTLLTRKGMELKEVQERLGHLNISTTGRYTHTNKERSKEASKHIQDILKQ